MQRYLNMQSKNDIVVLVIEKIESQIIVYQISSKKNVKSEDYKIILTI